MSVSDKIFWAFNNWIYIFAVVIVAVAIVGSGIKAYNAPSEAIEIYNKGIDAYNGGFYDLALEEFDKAIEKNPNYGIAWYAKGQTLTVLGRDAEAGACFNKAIQLGYTETWSNK